MKKFHLGLLITITAITLCACSHLHSVHSVPSKRNQCANIKAQIGFVKTHRPDYEQHEFRTKTLHLKREYQNLGCHTAI